MPPASPRDQIFDFGSVRALGQTLQHEFILANPSDRPIRLLGATALTPCCSGISPLPGVIPPRSEIKARVSFKPGFQSEGKRVEFEILTDSREWPVLRLAVSARIVVPWEIRPLGNSDRSVPLGKGGKQRFQLVARRRGDEGRTLPRRIVPASPLKARFQGETEEKVEPDGLIEATRDLEVTLPPSQKAGWQRNAVVFHWQDGGAESLNLS